MVKDRLHYKESHWSFKERTMEIKVISFIPKDNSVPVFETGSVLRFTGKFSLIHHNMLLEVIIY
ncbi:15109_t:CDS:2 [Rhizophagus irregularis]|nr:15109_t:CDS:2 [Rhizophagus irregularis]